MKRIKVLPNWKSHVRLEFSSGNPDNDYHPEPNIQIAFWKWFVTISMWMPFKPLEKKVVPNWDAATIERLGRDYYIDYTERRYGFYVSEGLLVIQYGRYSHDSSNEDKWSTFLPWTQWRHVRHTMYNPDGTVFYEDRPTGKQSAKQWDEYFKARENIEKVCFRFSDFDGEVIEVETFVEERQWKRGEGWFKWLSFFFKDQVRRSLDLDFTKEVGKRKGSWKGGTLGHSIDIAVGESYESAFRRYCDQQGLTFLEQIPALADLSRKKWRKHEVCQAEACVADGGASATGKR